MRFEENFLWSVLWQIRPPSTTVGIHGYPGDPDGSVSQRLRHLEYRADSACQLGYGEEDWPDIEYSSHRSVTSMKTEHD